MNDKYLYVKDYDGSSSIQSIAIKPSPSVKQFAKNVSEFSLSDDGKRMFVRREGHGHRRMNIVSATGKFPGDSKGTRVRTRDWSLSINPRQEWQQMFHDAWGHIAVLADQFTYSDGETFTAGIKALNIGPVIGKRTAGAGVWLSGNNRMVDGGKARVAEFAQFALDGRWIVEAYGVEPTIEVDNLPHETFKGKDAQLEAAINYLQQKIKAEPIKVLKPKAFPANGVAAEDIFP